MGVCISLSDTNEEEHSQREQQPGTAREALHDEAVGNSELIELTVVEPAPGCATQTAPAALQTEEMDKALAEDRELGCNGEVLAHQLMLQQAGVRSNTELTIDGCDKAQADPKQIVDLTVASKRPMNKLRSKVSPTSAFCEDHRMNVIVHVTSYLVKCQVVWNPQRHICKDNRLRA